MRPAVASPAPLLRTRTAMRPKLGRSSGSMERIGVVGLGVVGGTVARAFAQAGITTCNWDKFLPVGHPEELSGCSVVFLCVPTPRGDDGGHDVSAVWSAVEEIEPHLDETSIVAIKS